MLTPENRAHVREHFKSLSIGLGPCPLCGCDHARFTTSKVGLIVITCPPEHDGGCNTQMMVRGMKGQVEAIKTVTKPCDVGRSLRDYWLGKPGKKTRNGNKPVTTTPVYEVEIEDDGDD